MLPLLYYRRCTYKNGAAFAKDPIGRVFCYYYDYQVAPIVGATMRKDQRLYQEVLIRVGKTEMQGIDSLLENGHHGIAEMHTVQKFVMYVRDLESQLGINIPKADAVKHSGRIKIREGDTEYYI